MAPDQTRDQNRLTAARIAETLELAPLPHEGGMWAQSWRDEWSSAIYFLLQPGDFSAMHRLRSTEVWHLYGGSPVEMLLLWPDGTASSPLLGMDLANGHRPCVAVPPGVWMGAHTRGEWSLVGTTVAPPYTDSDFELAERDSLIASYAEHADQILALTR